MIAKKSKRHATKRSSSTQTAGRGTVIAKKPARRPKAKVRNRPMVPGSRRWARRMRALGLPIPDAPKVAKTPLKQLQAKWYERLADDGFDDIEWIDHSTGLGHNTPYLKRTVVPDADTYNATLEFYRLCTVYGTHAQFSVQYDKQIWALFSNGVVYRDILAQLKAKGMKRSLFYVWARIDAHLALMAQWHREHPEGLRHPGNYEEPFVVDVMLDEPDAQDAD